MSCGPQPTTFRLLDAYVGWDAASPGGSQGLTGLDDPSGVMLALAADATGVTSLADLLPYFPPPRVARGCGCRWYLASGERRPGLLVRDVCLADGDCWTNLSAGECRTPFRDPVAVAAAGRRVAVADRDTRDITVFAEGSWRIRAVAHVPRRAGDGHSEIVAIALLPSGELVVATSDAHRLRRFSRTGALTREWQAPGSVVRLAVDDECRIWLVTRADEGHHVWRGRADDTFERMRLADVVKALTPTGLVAAGLAGFCLSETDRDGLPTRRCYGWDGCPIGPNGVPADPPLRRVTHGQLLTTAIDSGIPRCRWHRIRIDADVPSGCTIEAAVASTDKPSSQPEQGVQEQGVWHAFPAGTPHPGDWQIAPAGSLDFLVDQPPGRYLRLRLRLTGDGHATPIMRRVRLDMPRSTSLERLPEVYSQTPDAEDFTERFLSLFDATIADLDRAIEQHPALVDAGHVPDDLLPWLAGLLDIVCDARWSADARRAIIRAAPSLYRQRGTVQGLVRAIQLATGLDAHIDELPLTRAWAALGRKRVPPPATACAASAPPPSSRAGARLGAVRLFSRSRARLRLGQSALGAAPIKSYGNPDRDPIDALAYRFRVLAPMAGTRASLLYQRLDRLVAAIKPAHTVASLRSTSDGFVVGAWSMLGVDTAIHSLPAPVLGRGGNVVLRRTTVLWPGPRRRGGGLAVGMTAAVGIHTVAR
ncbi:MAG: phage tail protein [Vicinamibacterales bacterium]